MEPNILQPAFLRCTADHEYEISGCGWCAFAPSNDIMYAMLHTMLSHWVLPGYFSIHLVILDIDPVIKTAFAAEQKISIESLQRYGLSH